MLPTYAHKRYCLVLFLCLLGCDSTERKAAGAKKQGQPPTKPAAKAPPPTATATKAPAATAGKTSAKTAARTKAVAATPPAKTKGNESSERGTNFIKDALLLYRVAACPNGTSAKEPPKGYSAAIINAHCRRLSRRIDQYRQRYVNLARPWLGKRQPPGLPTRVLYPFGGGDLLSALTTYEKATEITTMSLEHVGDVRGIRALTSSKKLKENLTLLRQTIDGLLALDDSTSTNMMKMQKTLIPGQLAFFLVALSVYGLEPVSLRYFKVEADGSLHYYSAAEIAKMSHRRAKRLGAGWTDPRWSVAFSNAELTFRRAGGPLKTHRHIAFNLGDAKFRDSPLAKHLRQKNEVVAMTKAAAYLLWRKDFSLIRQLLLRQMRFMVSDSTGIPPHIAVRHGFEVRTFGRYRRCFFRKRFDKRVDARVIKAWRKRPYQKLPFRYGYPDHTGHWHLMLTELKKATRKKTL